MRSLTLRATPTLLATLAPWVTLALLPGLSVAGASRLPQNLGGFTSVCTNAYFEEKDVESGAVASRLIARMDAALKKAGIPSAPGECQKNGLKAKKQLNLYSSFVTTSDGGAVSGNLEGWLEQEGGYKEVTLWNNDLFGEGEPGGASLDASDFLDDLMKTFLEDWAKSR